jgi:hypothetical protein
VQWIHIDRGIQASFHCDVSNGLYSWNQSFLDEDHQRWVLREDCLAWSLRGLRQCSKTFDVVDRWSFRVHNLKAWSNSAKTQEQQSVAENQRDF